MTGGIATTRLLLRPLLPQMETIEGTQDEIAKGFRTLQRINIRFRKARVRLYNKEASLLLATAGAGKFAGDLEAGRREREFLSCTASAKTTNPRKIHAPSRPRRTLASDGRRGRVRPHVPRSSLQQILVGNKHGRAPSAKQQSPESRDLGEFVAVTKKPDFPLSPSQCHPPTSEAGTPFSRGYSKRMLNERTQPRTRKERLGLSGGGGRPSFRGETLNTTATATFTCPGPQQEIPPCILDLFETHETAIRRTVFLNRETEEFFKSPGWIVQESRQQQLAGLGGTQRLSIPSRSLTRIITGQDLSSATSLDGSFQTRALPRKVLTSPSTETVDHRSDHQEGHSGANPAPTLADGAPKKPVFAPDGATSSHFVSSTTNSERPGKTSVLQSSTRRQSDRLPSRARERVEGGWNQPLRETTDRFPMPNRAGRTGSSSQVRLLYIDDRGCPRLACRNHCMHTPDEGGHQPTCGRRTRSDTQLEGLKRASDKTRSLPGNSDSQTHSSLDKTDKGGTDDVPRGRDKETQSATVGGAASEKRARERVAGFPNLPGLLCGEGIVASSASRIRKYGTGSRGTQQSPAGRLACALSRKHICLAEGQLRPSQASSLTNSYPPSREDSCSAGKRVPRGPRSYGPDPLRHAATTPSHLPPWGMTDEHSRPIAAFSRQSYRHRENVESRRGKGNVENFAFYEQVLNQSFRRSTRAEI